MSDLALATNLAAPAATRVRERAPLRDTAVMIGRWMKMRERFMISPIPGSWERRP